MQDYIEHDITPYQLCDEALRLIDLYEASPIPLEQEKQVILLLNKAEESSKMSKYQLSLARKRLAEYYSSQGITGSALEQYCMALELYPNLPVKKIVKSLRDIPNENLKYSLDGNMCGEPDYSNIVPGRTYFSEEYMKQREDADRKSAEYFGMSLEEFRAWHDELYNNTISELKSEAASEDGIYDPAFESEIESRLSKLDDFSRKEFYRIRANRKPGEDILSLKEIDLLELDSIEKSYACRKRLLEQNGRK